MEKVNQIEYSLNRILYVDDEPDVQDIVRISLEKIGGFTVKTCSSGSQALELVLSFKPDLILLDVMMPDMDGLTLLKAIRQIPELSNTPVIFITAKARVQEVSDYKEEGVLDVITKPFDPVMLPKSINNIWEKAHVRVR